MSWIWPADCAPLALHMCRMLPVPTAQPASCQVAEPYLYWAAQAAAQNGSDEHHEEAADEVDSLPSPKFSPFAEEALEGGSAGSSFKEHMESDSRDLHYAILAPDMAKPGCACANARLLV